jgi:hypothetical protein
MPAAAPACLHVPVSADPDVLKQGFVAFFTCTTAGRQQHKAGAECPRNGHKSGTNQAQTRCKSCLRKLEKQIKPGTAGIAMSAHRAGSDMENT